PESAVNSETEAMTGERFVITPGTYVVDIEASTVNWAGKKPLISGYVNSGTIDLTEGSVIVGEDTATGSFVIDMNTLKVGLTATKPNQETTLEGHLKSSRWFAVETYPTATFVINNFTPVGGEDKFAYVISGDLTMKGKTNVVEFPAIIYQNAAGVLRAEASTEIDRTKWDLTAGSGSFFDNLADNVVDDMVALSFVLEATK
ncbi:MAG TPA: YceI family protein, partial [Candidatus Paceibacterota bacterium]|nr:YceI family protein [Candidatus Paceibacterota bacterium]